MRLRLWIIAALAAGLLCLETGAAQTETLELPGLKHPVEILKDPWGIPHIYALNQEDLFFAQGFNAARDRLFQLELWRRQATGTLAEVLGAKALRRDIGARLLRPRGDLKRELNFYHPQGEQIIGAFVRGYNAYVSLTESQPKRLPLEFRLLGIRPGRWSPEIVVSRHNGLFRNATDELELTRLTSLLGTEQLQELLYLRPGDPDLRAAPGLETALLNGDMLELYRASREPVIFAPEDVVEAAFRAPPEPAHRRLPPGFNPAAVRPQPGSNNWVISGTRTLSGYPLMANDPHRALQVPSLRYWVHLVAPGWNVIGGGEPALPGVSIGHNQQGAWGLTIFAVDQEDLYVYDTHPEHPDRYRYRDRWEEMEVRREKIPLKGEAPAAVELRYTRHGPVLHQDADHHKAYALRAAWLEVGASPYLASLRINQARTWTEFREALRYFRTPSENMVWADREGNIGWQATGITPIRPNWDGLLPVPGDGRFEWDGYLPIEALPHQSNPESGYLATANEENLPSDYPFQVGFLWTEPFRAARLHEFLGRPGRFTSMDMIELQQDLLSLPARALIPLLPQVDPGEPLLQQARELLRHWNRRLGKNSSGAALYMMWIRRLEEQVWKRLLPEPAGEILTRRSRKKLIDWLTAPGPRLGSDPVRERDRLLLESLQEAVAELVRRQGADPARWRYGDPDFHSALIRHPLSSAVHSELRQRLDLGPVPQGGNDHTVNMTDDTDRQSYGATFRIIADLEEWDHSVGTNAPGQSGDPDSPHYGDLFSPWAKGRYFPVYYSRARIESVARSRTILQPAR